MADLYRDSEQVQNYVSVRPNYPQELIEFIVSKVSSRQLAWDAGTGNGQAAVSLSSFFDSVVATDSSPEQISNAPSGLSNLRFAVTPPSLSLVDFQRIVAPLGSVDLITVATALHWFDIPAFFALARSVLRRPGGVLAAWTYDGHLTVDGGRVDQIYHRVIDSAMKYVDAEVKVMIESGYGGVEFPFEAVGGVAEGTAPVIGFAAEREMTVEDLIGLLKTGTGYQRAREAGDELLTQDVVQELKVAWGRDALKTVKFPIQLRIGKVI